MHTYTDAHMPLQKFLETYNYVFLHTDKADPHRENIHIDNTNKRNAQNMETHTDTHSHTQSNTWQKYTEEITQTLSNRQDTQFHSSIHSFIHSLHKHSP